MTMSDVEQSTFWYDQIS